MVRQRCDQLPRLVLIQEAGFAAPVPSAGEPVARDPLPVIGALRKSLLKVANPPVWPLPYTQ